MIFNGTILNVKDNSGVKTVKCIKILKKKDKKCSKIGDIVLVVIRSIYRKNSEIKKGMILKGIIVLVKKQFLNRSLKLGDFYSFSKNSVILLNKNLKFLGTENYSEYLVNFKKKKLLKILSLNYFK